LLSKRSIESHIPVISALDVTRATQEYLLKNVEAFTDYCIKSFMHWTLKLRQFKWLILKWRSSIFCF